MPDYRIEQDRIDSFRNWPHRFTSPTPSELARCGFFFTDYRDKVKCFECSLQIAEWQENDVPCSLHQRFSGSCRYLRGLDTGNVRLGFDPSTIPPEVRRYDYGVTVRPSAVPDTPLHVHHLCEREIRHHEPATSNRNEDSMLCSICLTEEKSILFLPCLHLSIGSQCDVNLLDNHCLICRSEIQAKLKVFIV